MNNAVDVSVALAAWFARGFSMAPSPSFTAAAELLTEGAIRKLDPDCILRKIARGGWSLAAFAQRPMVTLE